MNILNCYLYYLSNLIEDDINKNEMKRKQNEQYWNNNQPKLTLTETQSNSNEQKFIIARFPGIQWTRLRLDMYGNTTPVICDDLDCSASIVKINEWKTNEYHPKRHSTLVTIIKLKEGKYKKHLFLRHIYSNKICFWWKKYTFSASTHFLYLFYRSFLLYLHFSNSLFSFWSLE